MCLCSQAHWRLKPEAHLDPFKSSLTVKPAYFIKEEREMSNKSLAWKLVLKDLAAIINLYVKVEPTQGLSQPTGDCSHESQPQTFSELYWMVNGLGREVCEVREGVWASLECNSSLQKKPKTRKGLCCLGVLEASAVSTWLCYSCACFGTEHGGGWGMCQYSS